MKATADLRRSSTIEILESRIAPAFASVIGLGSLAGTTGFKLSGVANYDNAGGSVSDAGDVNGDGFDDLIIGALGADEGGTNRGATYVVFGKAGGFRASVALSALDGRNGSKLSGVADNDAAGNSVSAAGDVNGDGFADLIIGAYRADEGGANSGAGYVVFGKADFSATLNEGKLDLSTLNGSNGFKLSGVANGDGAGNSVSAAGDVNGDGFDDLIIGADGADGGTGTNPDRGAGYVVFGKAGAFGASVALSGLNGSNGFKLSGVADSDYAGRSVSAAGDVNGDDFADLIIGAYRADEGGNNSGAGYVVFGKAGGFGASVALSGLDGSNGFKLSGVANDDYAGISVSAAGDVNGDGFADLIIGAYRADESGYDSGAGYVVFGKAGGFGASVALSGLDGSNGFKLSGVADGNFAGNSVSAAGDVNGDGFDDLIIGASGATGGDTYSGAAYVVFGQRDVPVKFSNGGKTATFTDVDGDLVTVKTTVGTFDDANFIFSEVPGAVPGGGQFNKLDLTDAEFGKANITITAKRSPLGGNGLVNLGFLDATGVDLGVVSIAGDLGRLSAGTVGGDAKVPALKSLTVRSLGLLGTSTQGGSGGELVVDVQGALPKLVVKDDLRANVSVNGATDGRLGSLTVGGSIVATSDVLLSAQAGIGVLKVGGDIRSTSTGAVSISGLGGALGAITVGGSIIGADVGQPVEISAFGQLVAPTKGPDLALKTLTVKGSVEHLLVAGGGGAGNADASIGSITVGGDWVASTVIMGATIGADFKAGTADDAKAGGRDNPAIFSTIGSLTVKGQALGTADTNSDMFGIVAERIGKAKVGGRTFTFTNGATPEAFFAASTLDGDGAEDPMFDFTIRELGSTTPTVALGGANLDISSDGKTATFTDVDGDLVTVKRTVGTFSPSDFTITAAASGGGLLRKLIVNPAPNNVAVNLSITAKVGPGGGNGFVNVGEIDADQTDLGTVIVGGELQDLDVGDNGNNRVGLGSLTVHSLGSVAGTSPTGDEINSAHGIGKIAVKTDIRNFHIFANNQDSGNLGSLTVGGFMTNSEIQAAANLGTIKIGGGFRDGGQIQATKRIGAITIGGDMIGGTIEAFANTAGPTKGLDLALKSFTVKGNVEATSIIIGRNNNADASLGAISVGRSWLASSVLAGVAAGVDTFTGTADDAKTIGAIDVTGRFSTIASIVIKGQALGSTAGGDSFGIVAEQILKAKIGTVVLKFDKGERDAADAFALAPTGPGATALASDFFIREITI